MKHEMPVAAGRRPPRGKLDLAHRHASSSTWETKRTAGPNVKHPTAADVGIPPRFVKRRVQDEISSDARPIEGCTIASTIW
jgi:hypothetical protein